MRKLAGFGFILAIFAYFRYPMSITIDPAMYLQAAELLLQGKKPYIDFLEINPPLIFYLNVPPVVLAKWTGLPSIFTFKIFLLGFIGAMGACLVRILSQHPLVSRRQSLFVIGFYFIIPVVLMFTKAGGQREHLFMTVFIPYFFMRTMNFVKPMSTGHLTIFLSVCCGLMACLKPYFIFIVASFELSLIYLLQSTKTLRQREVLAFVSIVILYLVHFVFWPQDMRTALFRDLVPEIAVHYGSFGRKFADLLWFRWYYWAFAVFSVVLLFILGADKRIRFMPWSLAVFGTSAVFTYFAQGKGWYYHFIPLIYSTVLAIPWIFSEIRSRRPFWFRSLAAIFLCLTTYYIVSLTYKAARGLTESRYMTVSPDFGMRPVRSVLEAYSRPGDSVVVFSASPIYSYPAFLQLGRYPGTRYLFHFPMSFYNNPLKADLSRPYPYKTMDQMSPQEVRYLKQIKSDIERNQPALIIFTKFRNEYDFLPANFDSYQYFSTNGLWPAFASQYLPVTDTPEIKAFQRVRTEPMAKRLLN